MNTLLIHQKQENTSFSSLLIKGSLISILSFLLLLSGILLQPDMLQHRQDKQALSRGLLQASFTAITSLPIAAQKPAPDDAGSTQHHAHTGESQSDFISRSCKIIRVQL